MGHIRAAAILAIDNRFRSPSLELKCLGTSFQSLGFQHGRRVIMAYSLLSLCVRMANGLPGAVTGATLSTAHTSHLEQRVRRSHFLKHPMGSM